MAVGIISQIINDSRHRALSMDKLYGSKTATAYLCRSAGTDYGNPAYWHLGDEPGIAEDGFQADVVEVPRTEQRGCVKEDQATVIRGSHVLIHALTYSLKKSAFFSAVE